MRPIVLGAVGLAAFAGFYLLFKGKPSIAVGDLVSFDTSMALGLPQGGALDTGTVTSVSPLVITRSGPPAIPNVPVAPNSVVFVVKPDGTRYYPTAINIPGRTA